MVDFKQSIYIPTGGQWGLGSLTGYPVAADISTRFGVKDDLHPVGHSGTDIAALEGTPIHAPADGTICDVFGLPLKGNQWDAFKSLFGNAVIIDHGDMYTMYGHMRDKPLVEEQQLVKTGDVLGYVGNTGYSFGAHLHWSLAKHDNRYFNFPTEQGPKGILLDALDYCQSPTSTGSIIQGDTSNTGLDKTLAMSYVEDIKIKLGFLENMFK